MASIPSYPPPSRPLDGDESIAAWQDGRQIALPVQEVIDAATSGVPDVAQPYVTQAQAAAAAAQSSLLIPTMIDRTQVQARNIFDARRVRDGYFVDAQGNERQATGRFFLSDFMPIVPGQQFASASKIVGSGDGVVAFFDASRLPIASMQNAGGVDYPAGTILTAPANTAIRYVRVAGAYSDSAPAKFMVYTGGAAPVAFQKFGAEDRHTAAMRTRSVLLAEMGPSRNLAAGAEITLNKLYNVNTGTYTDFTGAFPGYLSSLIRLPPVAQVTIANAIPFNSEFGAAWLDIDGIQIGKVNAPIAAGAVLTIPFGAAAIILPGTVVPVELYVGNAVPTSRSTGFLVDEASSIAIAANLLFAALPSSTNLFDSARVTAAAYCDRTTGQIVANPAASFTHDMPVQPGKPVIFSVGQSFSISGAGLGWKDRNGKMVGSGVPPPLVAGQPYYPPTGAATWFINYPIDVRTMFCGIGTKLPAGAAGTSLWSGKNWAMSGDSIVAQNKWQPTTAALLGVSTYTGWGVAGSKMADILTNRTSNDFGALDLYGVSSGTNDFIDLGKGTQTPLGSKDDAKGAATFWGASRLVIETVLGYKPSLRMFMMAPLHRGDEYKVAQGGTPLRSYRDAIIEIGTLYGLPVYDQMSRSGIGPATFGSYMQTDGFDNLHPNDAGGRLIGQQMARWIDGLGSS